MAVGSTTDHYRKYNERPAVAATNTSLIMQPLNNNKYYTLLLSVGMCVCVSFHQYIRADALTMYAHIHPFLTAMSSKNNANNDESSKSTHKYICKTCHIHIHTNI